MCACVSVQKVPSLAAPQIHGLGGTEAFFGGYFPRSMGEGFCGKQAANHQLSYTQKARPAFSHSPAQMEEIKFIWDTLGPPPNLLCLVTLGNRWYKAGKRGGGMVKGAPRKESQVGNIP